MLNNLIITAFKFSLIMISSITFMLPLSAWSAQNCDNPINDFDGLYCLTKGYLEADKALNNSYRNLVKQLNRQQRVSLKQGQLAWMRDRNEQCSYHETDGFYVNMDCATRMTSNRVNFLNERLRECHAGSCRDSRLDD